MYSFLDREKLLTTIFFIVNQLLTITHEKFSPFDCNPSLEVSSIFLDISKAFDKVWHEGFLYKLESFGISENLLNLIKHYIFDRQISKSSSKWSVFKLATYTWGNSSRIHFRTFFFLIFIHDFSDGLKSNIKLFADNTSLFSVVESEEESASDLTNDLDIISKQAYNWKVSFNPDPKKSAQEVLFSRKNSNITHNANSCQKTESFQYKAALAITGAIQGTSQEKLLEELGL